MAYMDEAGIEQRGLRPLAAQLAAIDAAATHDALAALMGQLLWQGVDLPFAPYVHIDGRQSNRYVVYLQQSGLGLPDRDYFLGDNPKFVAMRQHYRQFVADYLTLAGLDEAERRATAIYAIEEQLAHAQMSRVDNRDAEKTYNARAPTEMIALLGEKSGLTHPEAYMLCSLAGDLHITQTVNGNKGVHMMMNKTFVNA